MGEKVRIVVGDSLFEATLNDSETARRLTEMLPLSVSMSRWGDEYYGSIGATIPLEDAARDEMRVGELAYWPPGTALCIFFGPTPVSRGSEPRAAGACNPIGMIDGDATAFRTLGGSISARIERA